jgi:hypothetical protein
VSDARDNLSCLSLTRAWKISNCLMRVTTVLSFVDDGLEDRELLMRVTIVLPFVDEDLEDRELPDARDDCLVFGRRRT